MSKEEYIKRFHPLRLIEHWMNAFAFVALVLTGLSQRFHEYAISQWIVGLLGGIDTTRIVHRYSGILLAVLTIQHVFIASFGVLFRNWQPSMIIHKKDFYDAIDNMRFYFGMTEHPARCDRFDYKQKFEYWGVVIGGFLMVGTGLALWFPIYVTLWLPGELIPVAKALHANEALLAFLVIVTWHVYNAIFSPEVFPLDTVIFTSKISKTRMIHEHPLEYERMFGVSLEHGKHEEHDKSDLERQKSSAT